MQQPEKGTLNIMFRYFSYLCLVLPVTGDADIHNTEKCLALFSGNESDSSKQVENKLISLRLKQAWAVAYLYLWALSEPVALNKLMVPRFFFTFNCHWGRGVNNNPYEYCYLSEMRNHS